MANQIHYPSASPQLRQRQLAINKLTPTTVVRALVAGMAWPQQPDYEQLASVPVAVIHGEHDVVTPPARAEPLRLWLGERQPRLFVRVPNTGHNVMMEDPAAVNKVIDALLASPAD